MHFARTRRTAGHVALLLFLATMVTVPALAADGGSEPAPATIAQAAPESPAAPAPTAEPAPTPEPAAEPATGNAAPPPPAPAESSAQPPVGSAAPGAALSAQQLEAMVASLEDPAARAKLIEQLKVLIAAQKGTAQPGLPTDELPDTLGSRALSFLADRLDLVREQVVEVVNVFADLPGIIQWVQYQIDDPTARQRWVELSIQLGLIILAGVVIERFINWLLNPARRALAARAPRTVLGRLPLLLARAVLDLIPIAAFVLAAYGILSMGAPAPRVRMVALAIINATIVVQGVLLAARLILSPSAPSLRLMRIGDETAAYMYVWIRRLSAVAVYGYFAAEGAYVLGLPLAGYGAVLKLLGLLLSAMLIMLILQNRVSVADWLRGNPLSGDSAPGNGEAAGKNVVLRTARRRLADVWHVLAIAYVAVSFGIWALNVYGGFEYLVRATLTTIAIFLLARLVANITNRALRRGFRVLPELKEQFPHLEERANRYLPILHRLVKVVIWFVAIVLILNSWGADTVTYLESPLGRRILGSVVSITLILILSVIAWEVVSALIERMLATTDRNGTIVQRSARTRTLLPLLRNAFLVLLVTMVSLITLSELGVNIAPLLAGAGVVGLAIGFGAQTLVKDIITGLFILFEDTISVGDVVDVGGGHSGVVEGLSIRSIRLRDTAGAVHSIPFSAVTTVMNLTKDFSFAVFNVNVAYRENPDRVIEVLKELGTELQADPQFAPDILAPLEVMGLDRVVDMGIVILARFKTRPIKQWGVQREFNRRMKQRFEELGITIPRPHVQIMVDGDRGGAGAQQALVGAANQGS